MTKLQVGNIKCVSSHEDCVSFILSRQSRSLNGLNSISFFCNLLEIIFY